MTSITCGLHAKLVSERGWYVVVALSYFMGCDIPCGGGTKLFYGVCYTSMQHMYHYDSVPNKGTWALYHGIAPKLHYYGYWALAMYQMEHKISGWSQRCVVHLHSQ